MTKNAGYFIIEVEFPDGAYGEIYGKMIDYWLLGNTVQTMDLTVFKGEYPDNFIYLIDKKYIKIRGII